MKDILQVMKENENVSKKHNETFGTDFCKDLLMEECAELIQAISKTNRYPDDEKRQMNLCEEIGDVLILINELVLAHAVNTNDIIFFMNNKYERQQRETKNKGKEFDF